ncbi:MAG TPA: hypothetical protein VIX19_18580 [Terriglobales bacterium]
MGEEQDLAATLSHVEERVVTQDYTIRYQGRIYQIGRSGNRAGLRGGRVRVERRLDGSLAVRFRQGYVSVAECQPQPRATQPPRPRAVKAPRTKTPSNWMKGFDLQRSPPVWAIVKSEKVGAPRGTG